MSEPTLNHRFQKSVTVIGGVGQSGKTTFGNRFLVNGAFQFRFVFDPENEAAQRFGLAPTRTAYDLHAHLVRGWVLFDPEALFGSDYERAFDFFCEWVYAKSAQLSGAKAFMVDEVWKLCPNRTIPFDLSNIVRTGRKRGMASVFLTQTPNELPGVILNEVTEFVTFRLQSEAALNLVEKRGFQREEVAALPNLRFVSRSDLGGEARGELQFPARKTGRPARRA